ncbi:MAG: ABC transporter substrate-binding protein [Anaerolineaceae bacterium]
MKKSPVTLILLSISLILSACNTKQPVVTPLASQGVTAEAPTDAPTPTATEVPPLVLNVCMAEEPGGLYRYDGYESIAKQSVFAGIYIDLLATDQNSNQSLFFENIPSQENGGILLDAVPVKVGQPVLDSSGNVVYLSEGTQIEQAVNYSFENPVVWNHEQEYYMNQFTVTFKLLPDLKWSDGEALSADNFVFSYHLAEKSGLGHYKWAVDRTASFVSSDEQTLVWRGIPGFVPRDLKDILWAPMPRHQIGEYSDTQLLSSAETSQFPLGWGAYRLVGWEAGSQIVLEKNSEFVLSGQGLPAYDKLVFQVEPDLDSALQKLESGQCDILDKTYRLEGLEKSQLDSLSAANTLVGENWEPVQQLVFGITPAEYDQGFYNAWTNERQDILGDVATRQALAACISPETLLREYLIERLPEGMLFPGDSLASTGVDGNLALEEIGWIVAEESEGFVRIAQNVNKVLNGTELRLELLTGQSQLDQNIARKIAERLAGCGVGIEVQPLPVGELYRPGPDGLVFGRKFELALLSWQPEHLNLCQLYTSDKIPSSINSWVGTNLAGLEEPEFDENCWQISSRYVGEEGMDDPGLMSQYLPAIALMPQYRLWVYSNRISFGENNTFGELWRIMPEK